MPSIQHPAQRVPLPESEDLPSHGARLYDQQTIVGFVPIGVSKEHSPAGGHSPLSLGLLPHTAAEMG